MENVEVGDGRMNNTCIGGQEHQFVATKIYMTWGSNNTADEPPPIDAARYQIVRCAVCGLESVRWI